MTRRQAGVVVLLDPERILSEPDIGELGDDLEVRPIAEWVELRALWDLEIRRDANTLDVILLRTPAFASSMDLPWDVEQEAAAVVKLRWPVPPELRDVFRAAHDLADRLAEASEAEHDPTTIVANAFDFRPGDPASELQLIARLRTNPATAQAVWQTLSEHLGTEIARQTALAGGDLSELQRAWNDWVNHGDVSPYATQLEAAPGALAVLLASGLLTPVVGGSKRLPAWTALGIAAPDHHALLAELLERRPPAAATLPEWIETATWWGAVRSAVADLRDQSDAEAAWEAWSEINTSFSEWLRHSYGSSLQAAASTPRGLHQVAPFLARRVEDGSKIVLVVIDGLAFAQWTRLRAATGLHVEESTGCLAMIPTLTTISRQAIFAGSLPVDYSDTISTTSAEPRRWAAFWAEHGLNPRDVAYYKTLGATPNDVPAITGTVTGVVVNAVDEILHGAEVLGDSQVATSVDLWARTGFLEHLVDDATTRGYEVWITSDHGNIPTTPSPVPREGQTVESAGTRVRLYPNPVLRDGASNFGAIWDPPGIPRMALNPLFASGRNGFHTSGVRVSHGGTSIDEVIVPLVKVRT